MFGARIAVCSRRILRKAVQLRQLHSMSRGECSAHSPRAMYSHSRCGLSTSATVAEPKKEKKFSIFKLIKSNKWKFLYLVGLGLGWYIYDGRCSDEAHLQAEKMVGLNNEIAAKYREIFALSVEDVEAIMQKAHSKSYKGLIDIEYASKLIYERVMHNREKRKEDRLALQLERWRIEDEVRRQLNGEEITPVEKNTNNNTNNGWSSWLWGSSTVGITDHNVEPTVISKEYPFTDWLDDEENDEVAMKPLDPMLLLQAFASYRMRNIVLISVADVGIALSNIVCAYRSPTSPLHATALSKDFLHKYNLDMELIFTEYARLMEQRDGLMGYIDVLTGQQTAPDRCIARAQRAVVANNGFWESMSLDEQQVLTKRLYFVHEYKNHGRFYKEKVDRMPQEHVRLAWTSMFGPNKAVLNKDELTSLFGSMLTATHFYKDVLINRESMWPIVYKSAEASTLASTYFAAIGKQDTDQITVTELYQAAKIQGIMQNQHFWYMKPQEYSTMTDFQAWRLRKKLSWFGMDQEVIKDVGRFKEGE